MSGDGDPVDGPRAGPPSLLDRDASPDDLEAARDAPRPGVWAGEDGADLRALTQDETDALIRRELVSLTPLSERMQLRQAVGGILDLPGWSSPVRRIPRVQRGGIDSDPLVRVLARRAWGDRDYAWFEHRGVFEGDPVTVPPAATQRLAVPFVARAWAGETVLGNALQDAGPGQGVDVRFAAGGRRQHCRVSDRVRADHDEVEVVVVVEATSATAPGDLLLFDGLQRRVVRVHHAECGSRAELRRSVRYREELRSLYGFDRLTIERDDGLGGFIAIAEYTGRSQRVVFSEQDLCASRHPDSCPWSVFDVLAVRLGLGVPTRNPATLRAMAIRMARAERADD
jgi:hypothetical protein